MSDTHKPLVIEGEEAAAIKASPKHQQAVYTPALRAGSVVWYPGRATPPTFGHLAAEGLRTRSRKGERDGVKGFYVWAEKAS